MCYFGSGSSGSVPPTPTSVSSGNGTSIRFQLDGDDLLLQFYYACALHERGSFVRRLIRDAQYLSKQMLMLSRAGMLASQQQ